METLFTIELLRISGLTSSLAGVQRAYVLGWIGGRLFGRSKPLAAGTDAIDLTAEPQPWTAVVRSPETAPAWRFELWEDRGDLAPRQLLSLGAGIPSSYVGGTMTFGTAVQTEVRISRRDVPRAAPAVVPRVPVGQPTRATLAIPNTLIVELTDIRGLYKPGHAPSGVAHPRRAEPLTGYLSDDHKGRIYLNRDLTGAYARDQQQIELTARVTVVRGSLPAGAKIKWTIVDPDDAFDADPSVHRDATPIIDGDDHDVSGTPTGARASDNEGTPDHSPRWEAPSGFSVDVVSDTEAKTTIVANESKVVLHCPNCAGDDLIVLASIDSSVPVEVFPTQTGVMTMWHRVDVEYIKMATALDLPVDQVPPFFEEACAELNFSQPNNKPDRRYIAGPGEGHSAAASAYIDANAAHAREAGWFVVVAGIEADPPEGGRPSETIFRGRVRIKDDLAYTGRAEAANAHLLREYFTVRGDLSNALAVKFQWDGHEAAFMIATAVVMNLSGDTYTRLWLWPNDHTFGFTALDGSLEHAYSTQKYYSPRYHYDGAAWIPGGYGMPERVRARIISAGPSITEGVSPPLPGARGNYFCGRTVVFTHHHSLRNRRTGLPTPEFATEVISVIAHELVHAFGMPHRCGFFDHRTPREHTCHMNYSIDWMLDPADTTRVVPGFVDRMGAHLCARHLAEVRRVNLEDNDALTRVGW